MPIVIMPKEFLLWPKTSPMKKKDKKRGVGNLGHVCLLFLNCFFGIKNIENMFGF